MSTSVGRSSAWGSPVVTNALLVVVAGLLAVVASGVVEAATPVVVLLAVAGVVAVAGGALGAALTAYRPYRRGHHVGRRSPARRQDAVRVLATLMPGTPAAK